MSERLQSPAAPVSNRETRTDMPSLSDRVQSLRLPESQPGRSSPVAVWLLGALCVVLALGVGVLGYLLATKSAAGQGEDKNQENPQAAEPGAAAAAAASGNVVLEAKGYIIPVHTIQVSPRVSGMITKLFIDEGMRVKKDQVLAELERVDYESDRDHCQAGLDEAQQNLLELTQYRRREIDQSKARWVEAQVQSQQLEADLKRSNRLKSTSALADRDYEQAESAFRAMQEREKGLRVDYEFMMKGPRDNRIKAMEKRIRTAEADLAKAQWKLDNCTIRAPISGTILAKFAEEGNIVNQLSMNLKGSICDLANLADLEVDLSIQERDIARIFKNQKCTVRSEAYSDRLYDGVVSRLMPIADRAKGAVTVRVKVTVPPDEEGFYLKPDMGVLVSFLKKKDK